MSMSWYKKITCLLMAAISAPLVSTPNLVTPLAVPAVAKKAEILSRITAKLSEHQIFSVAEKRALLAVPTLVKNLIKDADPQLVAEFIALQESFEHIVRKLDSIEEDTSIMSRDKQIVKQLIEILLDITREVQPATIRAVGDVIFSISVTIKDKILEVLELLELLSDLNESLSETLESLIDIVIADINIDFAGTFTMLNAIESKIDRLTTNTTCNTCDFSGTYTAIAALQNTVNVDFAGTWTVLAAIQNLINVDFSGTWTAIAALQNTVNVDFSGTWTVLAAIQNLINVDFAGTYTAIAALQNTVNVDFSGTWTVLAAIQNLINVDFSGTWTAIAALQNTVNVDFAGTWTMIEALELCEPVCLTQANFAGGTFTAATPGIFYRLAENITGNFTVTASDVSLDLNEHALTGLINSSGDRTIIFNGKVTPAAPTSAPDAATAAITLTGYNQQVVDCIIICTDSTAGSTFNGRSGISVAVVAPITTNVIMIERCFIQAGAGSESSVDGTTGGAGGIGVNVVFGSITINISDSIIFGGRGGFATGGSNANGGAGGTACNALASSGSGVTYIITRSRLTGGVGGSGTTSTTAGGKNGGAGGNGLVYGQASVLQDSICTAGSAGSGGNGSGGSAGGNGGAGGIGVTYEPTVTTNAYILAERNRIRGGNGGFGGNGSAANNGSGGNGGSGILIKSGITGISTPSVCANNVIEATGIGGNRGGGSTGDASGGNAGHGIMIAGGIANINNSIARDCIVGPTGTGGNASGTGVNGNGGTGILIASGSNNQVSNCIIEHTGAGGAGGSGGGGTAGQAIVDNGTTSMIYNNVAYDIANTTAYTLGPSAAIDQPNGTAFLDLLTTCTGSGYLNIHRP